MNRRFKNRIAETLLLFLFAAFILPTVNAAIVHGVRCGDDAFHAMIAKNLAMGLGYSTTASSATRFVLTRFDPNTGVGPSLILPAALFVAVFGNREWVPGIAAVLLWSLRLSRVSLNG